MGSGRRDAMCWKRLPRRMIQKLESGGGEERFATGKTRRRRVGHTVGTSSFHPCAFGKGGGGTAQVVDTDSLGAGFAVRLVYLPALRGCKGELLLARWTHSVLLRMPGLMTRASGRVCALLDIGPIQDESARSCGNLPLVLREMGLPSRRPYQCLGILGKLGRLFADDFRQAPCGVAHCFVEQLEGHPLTPFLSAAAASVRVLKGTMGFDPPTWQSLCEGARPELLEPDNFEPGMERDGWARGCITGGRAVQRGSPL